MADGFEIHGVGLDVTCMGIWGDTRLQLDLLAELAMLQAGVEFGLHKRAKPVFDWGWRWCHDGSLLWSCYCQ